MNLPDPDANVQSLVERLATRAALDTESNNRRREAERRAPFDHLMAEYGLTPDDYTLTVTGISTATVAIREHHFRIERDVDFKFGSHRIRNISTLAAILASDPNPVTSPIINPDYPHRRAINWFMFTLIVGLIISVATLIPYTRDLFPHTITTGGAVPIFVAISIILGIAVADYSGRRHQHAVDLAVADALSDSDTVGPRSTWC